VVDGMRSEINKLTDIIFRHRKEIDANQTKTTEDSKIESTNYQIRLTEGLEKVDSLSINVKQTADELALLKKQKNTNETNFECMHT